MKEALFYKKLNGKIVKCELCPRECIIKQNNKGICLSRKNISGKLISLTYGKPCALNLDPIEKKPIFHVIPGHKSYSIGTFGCQLFCKYCQNWEMARGDPENFKIKEIKPEEIVKSAIKNNCKSIAYTYNDPVVFYEYVLDIAKLAKKSGLKNVIVSNGYINEKPLKLLCKFIDAANIDLKGFKEEFYKNNCFGKLEPVLKTLKILKDKKIWLEITNLIIPELNDNTKDIDKMCKWIKNNLGSNVPLHFSRFSPMHKMLNKQMTPIESLERAYKIAKKNGINYVYIGNIQNKHENTYCYKCNSLLIERNGYSITKNNIKQNKCYNCNAKVSGVFN